MNNLKEKIIESLKWKKHPMYCAEKLNITESQYKKIKKEVLQERKSKKKKSLFFSKAADSAQIAEAIDLENGTGKLSGTFDHEPKSAEEIIMLLKIDTDKWKLSQYWNKQMGDHWRVSALVSQIKNSDTKLFEDLLENWTPKKYKISNIPYKNKFTDDPHCAVISLQDIHFGKEGNDTIDKDFEDTVKNLVTRANAIHHIETMYFVVGGDLINMDTFQGTTTSGTPLDNCEHGDKRSKNNPLIYASEYPKAWGDTTNRTLFKGHIHTDRKVEYMTSNETAGFIEKTLPSLGKTDYYHYSNKYVGNRRSGKLEIQHPTMGNICVLTYQAI